MERGEAIQGDVGDFVYEGSKQRAPIALPTGEPLFDEMLSYCSCLHLAQWLEDFKGPGDVSKNPLKFVAEAKNILKSVRLFAASR